VNPQLSGRRTTAEVTVEGSEPRHVVLYFHGGVYAWATRPWPPNWPRRSGRRRRLRSFSVDYRLAPEHPYPAAEVDDALAAYEALLDDGIAPSEIVFTGESAGAASRSPPWSTPGARTAPAGPALLMSPYADLTLAGTTIDSKREVDPLLSREALQAPDPRLHSRQDAGLGLISAEYSPTVRSAAADHPGRKSRGFSSTTPSASPVQAATADVEVTLDITPGLPHVFQAYHAMLDEATAALDRAGQLLSAHLAGAAARRLV